MSFIKCSIKSNLFENENKQVLTEQDEDIIYEEMAEGLVWDFLSADVRKLIHAGAAIKLGDTIEKQVAKVLKKDNKNIMRGLDLLRKSYSNRKAKLEKLRDKIFAKIDANTAINDTAKNRFKQVIQKALDDTNEMVNALEDQDDRVEAEMEPGHFDPNDLAVDAETPEESPEEEVVDEPVASSPESSKDIISSLSKLNDVEKNKAFKKKMVDVLVRDGFNLLGNLMNQENLKEELSLSDYNSLQKSSKQFIINVLGRHLQQNPDSNNGSLYKNFKNLDRNRSQQISTQLIDTIVKLTADELGEGFFGVETGDAEPVEPTDTEISIADQSPEEIADLVTAAKNTENTEELIRIQKEVSSKAPEKWAKVGELLQASKPVETPIDVPDGSPEEPEVTSEPEQPESDIPLVNQMTQSDDTLEFLLSKKLVSSTAAQLFKELSPENQKLVTDYAIQQITNISDSIKDIQSGELDEAELTDLGFNPEEFSPEDLKDVRKWVRNITNNVSKKIKMLHKQQGSLSESISKIRENMKNLFGTHQISEVTIDADSAGKKVFEAGDIVWFDEREVEQYLNRGKDNTQEKPALSNTLKKAGQNLQQTNEEEGASSLESLKNDLMKYDRAENKVGVISNVEKIDDSDWATVRVYDVKRSKIDQNKLNLKPNPKESPIKVPFEYLNLIRKDELVPPEIKDFLSKTAELFGATVDLVKKFTPSDQDTGWTS
jgi:hypothetical protein